MKKIVSSLVVFSVILGTSLSSFAYDVRTGIVGYYPFASSTTADAAYINNFTAVGSPVLVTTNVAPRSSALQLNGTSQYLRLDHTPDNSATGMPIYRAGTFTIAMWVKGAPQTAKYLFALGNSTNAGGTSQELFCIQTGNIAANNSKLDLIIRAANGSTTPLNHPVSSSAVFDNNWHHIAWVDNRGSVRLYIDGNLDGNNASFSYTPSGTYNFDRTAIGALMRNTAAGFFNGAIDDVGVWERPLSQAEVQNIMANGVATPVPALPPALLAEPASITKNYLDGVTFSVVAQATRPNLGLTYQWSLNNSPILDATNRTYRLLNLTTNNTGQQYSVTVTAGGQSATSSNAVLTVLEDGPANVASNVISYWPFDSVTNDAGIYSTPDFYAGNNLTLVNMTDANLVAGQFTNALEFDWLENRYAIRTTGSPTYKTTGYSVSMWVLKPTLEPADSAVDRRVFAEASTNSQAPLFTIGTTTVVGSPYAKINIRNDANSTLVDRTSTRPVFDGNWHHLVWTDVNGDCMLYVDGEPDETDFSYTPTGTFTLNTTAVGALVRSAVGNHIYCRIDEVATWSRALTYTEVQSVKISSVPVIATPVSFAIQPASTNVLTKATASFSVQVNGTAPFAYQWLKGNSPLSNQTNATLVITNVQTTDAGTYKVTVTNPAGSTNSLDATLDVTVRPAPPAVLAIDFNERNSDPINTEPGFSSFTLSGTSGGLSTPTSRTFGGVDVTVAPNVTGTGGTTVDSRLRPSPGNSIDFTQEKLLRDFVFSTQTTGGNGLDVTVDFMEPNKAYAITVWSYDSSQTAGDRVSQWYANGDLVKGSYTFNTASVAPSDNTKYQFSFYATSDSNGRIVIQGRREPSSASQTVFLNALKINSVVKPEIDTAPRSQEIYAGGDLDLSVTAVGVGPFTYQWYKGPSPIGGATSRTYHLANAQLSDAGSYSVVVSNDSGPTTSGNADITVIPRPATPSVLAVDFNQRGESNTTEVGFSSFALQGAGVAIDVPTTRFFNGIEVTVSGSTGTTVDSRSRTSITNNNTFTESALLRDFIYSTPTTGGEGLDVRVRYLAPNQLYNCTIWSFDDQQTRTNQAGETLFRNSDWFANGVMVKENYSFIGTIDNEPTDNSQYQFRFNATSDANGTILLQGRRDMIDNGIGVFLNALRIAVPQTVISSVERVGGNLRLIVETPDSSQAHAVEQTDAFPGEWSNVTGVTSTVLSPTSIRLEFAEPGTSPKFYRIKRP